ncbi:MAG: fasciclin domain-containing protein [Bacteroidales bacterium]
MKKLSILFVLIFSIIACNKDNTDNPSSTIPDTSEASYNAMMSMLKEQGNFSSYMQALEITEIKDMMMAIPELTIMAPNDEAFDNYLNTLGMKDINQVPKKDLIKAIELTIMPGKTSMQSMDNDYMETLRIAKHGNKPIQLFIHKSKSRKDQILVMSSEIIQMDMPAENYIVNEVNQVMLPPMLQDFVQMDPNLNLLNQLLQYSNRNNEVFEMLAEDAPMTTFWPDNATATKAMNLAGYKDVKEMPMAEIDGTIKDHLVLDKVEYLKELKEPMILESLSKKKLTLTPDGNKVRLDYGTILETEITKLDIQADNGTASIFTDVKIVEPMVRKFFFGK